ncbi:hypothetical protein LZZ90_08245 [Flavobacterium sp. SM15]|uniref:hypothetical protein n=1 Tax=Flavobacterium sp. SM15 TaxID=2908005 RepID=UPI001EDABA25|nr:hypothetical protein [Flavobacterium sp. SM15]MCG2611496.1 hypothetical protein [Flavobacterium sp. SM15]
MESYEKLNRYHQFLSEFDFDKMDKLDFIFYQTFNKDLYSKEIEPLLKKLTEAIDDAKFMIEKDCQKALKNYNN